MDPVGCWLGQTVCIASTLMHVKKSSQKKAAVFAKHKWPHNGYFSNNVTMIFDLDLDIWPWYYTKPLTTRNTHVKYDSFITYYYGHALLSFLQTNRERLTNKWGKNNIPQFINAWKRKCWSHDVLTGRPLPDNPCFNDVEKEIFWNQSGKRLKCL